MRVLFWALLAALLWGIGPVLDKLALRTVSPVLGALLRAGTAGTGTALLLLMGLRYWGEALRQLPSSTWAFLFLSGLLGSVLAPLAYMVALREGETSQVVPLASSSPLFAALLAMLVLQEPISGVRWLGILLITLGVILVQR